jgi:hypothetical protein
LTTGILVAGGIPDTSTSHQCNRDAISGGLKNPLRLTRFQHINSYVSVYRQLRVSMSNRPRLRGTCTSVRALASPFCLAESTRLSPPAWSDSQEPALYKTRPSSCLVNVGGTSDLTMDAGGIFSVPFPTPGDYDLTVGVPPGLLRMIGAKRNISRSGPSAGGRIRSFLSMSRLSARRF